MLIVTVTLGLAIGACTTIYSVVYGVVLQPLPYSNPDRLVHLWQVRKNRVQSQFSDPNFEDLRSSAHSFTAVAEYNQEIQSVIVGDLPLRVTVSWVSRDFFDVFLASPALGRPFSAEELIEGGARAALVSDRFWREHFGGSRELAMARLRIGREIRPVVGVLSSRFDFPAGTDIWLPRETIPRNPHRTSHNWRVVARLRDGTGLERARAESSAIARRLKDEYGELTSMSDVAVVPLREEIVGPVRSVLMLLLMAVGFLVAITSANLANLLTVRAAARRHELAVRSSLGATGAALIVPIAAESVLLSLAGGALGVALARGAMPALGLIESLNVPRLAEVRVSWPVVAFAIATTTLTALVLGLVAAYGARRPNLVLWLKEGQPSHTGSAYAKWLRYTAVAAQLAMSVVLLVGAALLGRSLVAVLRQNPGFRTQGVLTVRLARPQPEMRVLSDRIVIVDPASVQRQAQLNKLLIDRLGALPGLIEAGGINGFPMTAGISKGTFILVHGDEQHHSLKDLGALYADPTRTGQAEFRVASSGYFRAMGIALIRGRSFEERDTADAPHVALINESLARQYWPDQDPLGKRIQFGGMDGDLTIFTVVGVVGDTHERALEATASPTFYADYRQRPLTTSDFTIALQTSIEPTAVVADARRVIRELAPEVPPEFRTVTEVVDGSTAGRRFTFALLAIFAGSATMLALLGIYGVLSQVVAARHHEFAVRMALGAQPAHVYRLLLNETVRMVGVGLILGAGAALAMRRVLEGMLFGVTSTDLLTHTTVVLGLSLAALIAALFPVVRATRLDPVQTLRTQ